MLNTQFVSGSDMFIHLNWVTHFEDVGMFFLLGGINTRSGALKT